VPPDRLDEQSRLPISAFTRLSDIDPPSKRAITALPLKDEKSPKRQRMELWRKIGDEA
jgi:hypothetical protein